jgi:hypothetical protein
MKIEIVDNRKKGERIYYLSPMSQKDFKRILAKARLKNYRPCNCSRPPHFAPKETQGWFTKKRFYGSLNICVEEGNMEKKNLEF